MFLSDRDIQWALETGELIIRPLPEKIGSTSVDLHLDKIEEAKIWNLAKIGAENKTHGNKPHEVRIGTFDYRPYSVQFLISLPTDERQRVFRRGNEVIIRPRGFLLWQTREVVGTPKERAGLICFIEGKSTKARTGLVVHMTAPTIHATWVGNVTLEIANLGPLTFVLQPGDAIAQLTVSTISSAPREDAQKSVTFQQANVSAQPGQIEISQPQS